MDSQNFRVYSFFYLPSQYHITHAKHVDRIGWSVKKQNTCSLLNVNISQKELEKNSLPFLSAGYIWAGLSTQTVLGRS